MITIFSTINCPRCSALKHELIKNKIKFNEHLLSDIDSLTELYSNGIFTLSAPILQIDDIYYTPDKLFSENNLIIDIQSLVK